MNLYILDRTPLNVLGRLAEPPDSGDIVVFLRPGQDPDGARAKHLAGEGIQTVWGESLLGPEDSLETDRLGMEFLNRWYWENGTDVTRTGEISFGKLLDWEIGRLVNPAFMVRTGEIVRLALEAYPDAGTVYSDIADGEGLDQVPPAYRPLGRVVRHVAQSLSRDFRAVEPVNPLHPLIIRNMETSLGRVFIRFLGGFRPRWLMARLRRSLKRLKPDRRRPVYAFMGRGTDLVVGRLLDSGRFRLFVNSTDIAGTDALRPDHIFAIPSADEVRNARRTIERIRSLADCEIETQAYTLNSIAYGPFLAQGAMAVIKTLLWPNLFTLAQAKKLAATGDFAGFIVNGDAGFLLGTLIDANRATGKPIYYIGHGMNTHRSQSFGMAHNNPHVTYFATGSDHLDEFGHHLPEAKKPRRIALGNPLTTLMNPVRRRRPHPHGKRILVLGCGFPGHATATRARTCERFLADVFQMSRGLSHDGWRISYRGHPHHAQLLEREVARAMALDGTIHWNDQPDLNDALLTHDVVITAMSSTFYQCLWAGWPTIYYDPKCLDGSSPEDLFPDELFVGLPVARDIEWPLASDVEELSRLVTDSLDTISLTSTFPEKFATVYAPRFIGPQPAESDAVIAAFIEEDLSRHLAAS